MSTKIGDLAVYISANTARLGSDLARGMNMVSAFAGGVTRRMGNVADAFGFDVRPAGLAALVKSSVDLAGAAEVAAMKFETILGSVKEAATLMADLKGFAANSPMSLADASEGATRLLAGGIERAQIAPTLRALSDTAMGDPQQTKDLIRAYTQVKATGRLQGDEWNQIANIGTLNFKDLAKVLKVDETQVKKLIETGQVGFYELQLAIKAATDEGGRFAGLGEKYAQTYAGKVDKLKDSWDEVKRTLGRSLVDGLNLKNAAGEADSLVSKAGKLAEVLKPAVGVVKEIAGAFIDAASGLYKFGQRAAAWVQGDLGVLRAGDAAKEHLAAAEKRALMNMGKHGIDMRSAYDLADFVDIEAKFRAEAAASRQMAHRAGWDAQAAPNWRLHNEGMALKAKHEKDAMMSDAAAVSATEQVKRILARGDPSRVTLKPDGFTPVKPLLDARLADLASQLNEKFVDPLWKFNADLADLRKMRDVGRLGEDVFALAVQELTSTAAKNAGLGPPQLAAGVELGSQQLASMVARAGVGQGPQTVEGLLAALNKTQQDNLAVAKQIAAGVGAKPPVVTAPE